MPEINLAVENKIVLSALAMKYNDCEQMEFNFHDLAINYSWQSIMI